jgi:DegV family protein with EDD domain
MIKIITDTTAGLPAEIAARYDIPVIPQIVSFGDESFFEGKELDNTAFLARLRSSAELPKTSAPPPELFAQEFARWAPTGMPILCIHPSAEVSGTVRSASVAALEFPGADIRVIDTRVVASPLATLVELAAEWAACGDGIDLVESRLKRLIPRCRIYFLVATLEYLARGGRIGGAAALLGGLLQIKPILTMRGGVVDQYDKERTHKRAVARLISITLEQYPTSEEGYISVMHAGVPDQANALAAELRTQLGVQKIPILDVPPAIVTHGGPGILGVAFFTSE